MSINDEHQYSFVLEFMEKPYEDDNYNPKYLDYIIVENILRLVFISYEFLLYILCCIL